MAGGWGQLVWGADPAVPTQSTGTEDAIATAKRQLDALKANAANGPDTSPMAGLHLAVPEFHGEPDEPLIITPPAAAAKPSDQRSANWLVDAMLKPKGDSAQAGRDHRGDPRNQRSTRQEARLFEASDMTTASSSVADGSPDAGSSVKSDGFADRLGAAPNSNPFARYMADWMSPSDYALLKPDLEKPSGAASSMGQSPLGAPVLPSDTVNAWTAVDRELANGSKPPPLPASPSENPFLAGLNAPDITPSTAPAPVVAPAQAEPVPMITPAVSPPTDRSAIPDFAKPNNDDKYFKPLKRF